MNKIDPFSTGLATAIALMVINTLCAAVVVLSPDTALNIANSFAHGLDLRMVKSAQPMSFSQFLMGLVSLAAIGFVAGIVFAWSRNLVSRH